MLLRLWFRVLLSSKLKKKKDFSVCSSTFKSNENTKEEKCFFQTIKGPVSPLDFLITLITSVNANLRETTMVGLDCSKIF